MDAELQVHRKGKRLLIRIVMKNAGEKKRETWVSEVAA